jgi:ketosteroid isomerase-like protein
MSDTRAVVETYFKAWTTKDVEAAYACLASDLQFAGPSATYTSAEQFRPALAGFASLTKAAKIVELVTEGDRVAMLYDCELVPPATTPFRIASFFWVRDGKIARYETWFDPAQFQQVRAARS